MSENNNKEINEDQTESTENQEEVLGTQKKSPMKLLTSIVFVLSFLIFVWYIFSDRITPYTDQARITELIIPITPRVSGYLREVNIELHSVVKADSVLFVIDTVPFSIAIQKAMANVDNTNQQMGVQGSSIKAAASSVGVAKAQLDRAQRNYNRTQRIIKKNPGAVSQADIDRVETSLNQAIEALASSEANLSKAEKQLGIEGPENPQLRLAVSELENAQLELSFTSIYSPSDGYIESFNIDKGYYCQAGQPIATLVSNNDIWIQADFKENNISNMKIGDKARIILDIAPGKVFEGHVRSIGFGINSGNTVDRGGLPSINSSSSWLRDPQRFPVIIAIDDEEAIKLSRAGGQADIVVYTDDGWFLNSIATFRIKTNTWLSYVR